MAMYGAIRLSTYVLASGFLPFILSSAVIDFRPAPFRIFGGSPGLLAPDESRKSSNITPSKSVSPVSVSRLNSRSFARLAAFLRLIRSLLYFFALRISDFVCFLVAFAVRFVALTVRFSFRTARFDALRPARARLLLASFRSTFFVARLTLFRADLNRFATALLAFARSFESPLLRFLRATVCGLLSHSGPLLSCSCVLSVLLLAARARELPTDQLLSNSLTQDRRFLQALPCCRVE